MSLLLSVITQMPQLRRSMLFICLLQAAWHNCCCTCSSCRSAPANKALKKNKQRQVRSGHRWSLLHSYAGEERWHEVYACAETQKVKKKKTNKLTLLRISTLLPTKPANDSCWFFPALKKNNSLNSLLSFFFSCWRPVVSFGVCGSLKRPLVVDCG